MPYIKSEEREKYQDLVEKLSDLIESDGELNYVITLLMHKQIYKRGLKYQNLNNLIGALECAKLELYRKVIGGYEDQKILINGPITGLDNFLGEE